MPWVLISLPVRTYPLRCGRRTAEGPVCVKNRTLVGTVLQLYASGERNHPIFRRGYWGIAQLVERPAVNRIVVGSSPTIPAHWGVAQVVEHLIWDQEVVGSSPTTPISLTTVKGPLSGQVRGLKFKRQGWENETHHYDKAKGVDGMIVELCMAIVIVLPICFVGAAKSRKSASGEWIYVHLISYSTVPSWHDNCIKPTGDKVRVDKK